MISVLINFQSALNEQSATNHIGRYIPLLNTFLFCSISLLYPNYNMFFKIKSICSTNNAEKEDIYQLGVILLEVITGRQIASSSEVEQLKDEVSITTFLLSQISFIKCS